MSRGRRRGETAEERVNHRIRVLRQELTRLERLLDADERWRALVVLDKHPERNTEPAMAARTRLVKALETHPVYRARAKLLEVISLLSAPPPDDTGDAADEQGAWYRSLRERIAEIIDARPAGEPGAAVEPTPEAATAPGDGAGAAPRSFEIEEAEVVIIERSPPRPADEDRPVAMPPADAFDGAAYTAYRDIVEEATVEIVYPDARRPGAGSKPVEGA